MNPNVGRLPRGCTARQRSVRMALSAALLGAVFPAPGGVRAAAAFTAHSAGKADVVVSHDGADYLRFGTAAWGPNWSWAGVQGATRKENGATVGTLRVTVAGTTLRLEFRAARTAPNRLEMEYGLQAEKDTELTLVVVEVTPGAVFDGREVIVASQGQRRSARVPFGKRPVGEQEQLAGRITSAVLWRWRYPSPID